MIEILQCLDNLDLALQNVKKLLSKNGIIFINFPINSPAPDNVCLISDIEQLKERLINNGFLIKSFDCFTNGGISIEKAINNNFTISCIVSAYKKIYK